MTASRNPASVHVRRATPDEYGIIGDLSVEAYAAGGHLSEAYAQTLRAVGTRAAAGDVWVAVDAETIVGTVTICPPGTTFAEISHVGEFEFRFLSVHPSAWGRGVAAELVAACVAEARAQSCSAIVICVLEPNELAHRLYQRLGFERLPERDWSPIPGIDLQAYCLRLDGKAAGAITT